MFSSLKKTKEGSSRWVHLRAPSTILSIFCLLSFSKPSTFLVLASAVYLSRMYKVALLLKVHNKLLWNGELLAVDHYSKGIYWDPVNANVLFTCKKRIFICRFLFFASRVAGSLNDFCCCFFNFNFNDLKKPR